MKQRVLVEREERRLVAVGILLHHCCIVERKDHLLRTLEVVDRKLLVEVRIHHIHLCIHRWEWISLSLSDMILPKM